MKRSLLIIKRFFCCMIEIPKNAKEFGFAAAIWIWWVTVLPSQKGTRYIKFLTRYFDNYFKPITKQFEDGTFDRHLHIPINHREVGKKPVWVCWLQGEENMPELIKVCYTQLKKNIPRDAQLHLLTLNNIDEYITLPSYIENKFKSGKIQPAHYSDIVRFCLLFAYGGLWIDATVFTVDEISNKFFDNEFWTQKAYNKENYIKEPSKADWCGFLLGGQKESIFFGFMREALFKYWKEHNQAIDYIMFDYMILAGYNNILAIRKLIDDVEYNNENIWTLTSIMNEKYDEKFFNELTKDTHFFKLTYKMALYEETNLGEDTYFKNICKIAKENI